MANQSGVRQLTRLLKNQNIVLAGAVICAASMWFYVQRVMVPYQGTEAARLETPRGNLSDLYPRWLGARELLLHHRDPYSRDVTNEIEIGYYGRALDPKHANDPVDEQAFAYPVYVVFFLAPTILFPFPQVQREFLWLLSAVTIASALLWIQALRWRISLPARVSIAVFMLGSFPVVQALKLQQLTLLVAALIAASIVLVTEQHLLPAGVLLACATIKPQLTLPVASWLILWAAGRWKQRRRLLWAFVITLAVLFAAGEVVLNGWISQFYYAVLAYRQYTGGAKSIAETLTAGWWASIVIAGALAVLCWRHRRSEGGSEQFNWVTALVLATTVIIVPKTAPYNQVLLLPGVLFLLMKWRAFLTSNPQRIGAFIGAACVAWPWIGAICLMIASVVLPQQTVLKAWLVPLYTTFATPVLITFGLFWLM